MGNDETITLRVTRDFKNRVVAASKKEGLTMSAFIKQRLSKAIR